MTLCLEESVFDSVLFESETKIWTTTKQSLVTGHRAPGTRAGSIVCPIEYQYWFCGWNDEVFSGTSRRQRLGNLLRKLLCDWNKLRSMKIVRRRDMNRFGSLSLLCRLNIGHVVFFSLSYFHLGLSHVLCVVCTTSRVVSCDVYMGLINEDGGTQQRYTHKPTTHTFCSEIIYLELYVTKQANISPFNIDIQVFHFQWIHCSVCASTWINNQSPFCSLEL